MRRDFVRRHGPLLGVAVAAAATAALLTVIPATTATAAAGNTAPRIATSAPAAPTTTTPVKKNDVFIRDTPADNGSEPSTVMPVFESPDIWTCRTTAPCTGVDPVIGSTNYVNVHLNNVGQLSVAGDVNVYYTAAGASALWPDNWVTIGVSGNLSVPPGGLNIQVPWTTVPGPGHFCLLARFVSSIDPMTTPEGPDTQTNTINNNNIAWHNIDTVALSMGKPSMLPFTMTNTTKVAENTDLVFTAQNTPFIGPGTLIVDLGPVLAQRWAAAGQPGIGVSKLNGTQVQILDPRNAQILGLALQPRESQQTELTFLANESVNSVVTVDETSTAQADLGGVEYNLSTSAQA